MAPTRYLSPKKSTMFNWLNKKKTPEPQPLQVEGIAPAPITPDPDDAELAAQALLESLAEEVRKVRSKKSHKSHKSQEPQEAHNPQKDSAYYHRLAEKIRLAQEAAILRATRFVAACEYKLKDKHLPFYGEGSLGMLEAELYKRLDIIERAEGDLKRRWQHCLAEVTVRLMEGASQVKSEEKK